MCIRDSRIEPPGAGIELFASPRGKQFRFIGRIGNLALIGLEAEDIIFQPTEFADLPVHLIGCAFYPPCGIAAPYGKFAAVTGDRLVGPAQPD